MKSFPTYKFDEECVSCINNRRPRICAMCDYGEYFQDKGEEELCFDEELFDNEDAVEQTNDDAVAAIISVIENHNSEDEE